MVGISENYIHFINKYILYSIGYAHLKLNVYKIYKSKSFKMITMIDYRLLVLIKYLSDLRNEKKNAYQQIWYIT